VQVNMQIFMNEEDIIIRAGPIVITKCYSQCKANAFCRQYVQTIISQWTEWVPLFSDLLRTFY
jgi:hypothetical protein